MNKLFLWIAALLTFALQSCQKDDGIREEIDYKGVSVIIPRRECIQTLARRKRKEMSKNNHETAK